MAEARYFWLKLQHDFFQSKRIKKLRNIAGGDTFTIIYLKMQLLAIRNGGKLTYSGLEPTFAEELALDLDEEPENVLVTVNYLLTCGLLEEVGGGDYIVPYAIENTGSETSAAKRMRDYRAKENVTLLQQSSTMFGNRYGEKEIEKEKESDKEVEGGPAARASLQFFIDRINPSPSGTAYNELVSFVDELGDEVVLHALHIAVDERKTSWSYIKAILRRYQSEGLKDLPSVLDSEKKRQEKKEKRSPGEQQDQEQIIKSESNQKTLEQLRRLRDRINGGGE